MRAYGKKTGEGAASAVDTRNKPRKYGNNRKKQTTFGNSTSGLVQYAGLLSIVRQHQMKWKGMSGQPTLLSQALKPTDHARVLRTGIEAIIRSA